MTAMGFTVWSCPAASTIDLYAVEREVDEYQEYNIAVRPRETWRTSR
jgi:hypothetical protein